jgi:hypothetical protein
MGFSAASVSPFCPVHPTTRRAGFGVCRNGHVGNALVLSIMFTALSVAPHCHRRLVAKRLRWAPDNIKREPCGDAAVGLAAAPWRSNLLAGHTLWRSDLCGSWPMPGAGGEITRSRSLHHQRRRTRNESRANWNSGGCRWRSSPMSLAP